MKNLPATKRKIEQSIRKGDILKLPIGLSFLALIDLALILGIFATFAWVRLEKLLIYAWENPANVDLETISFILKFVLGGLVLSLFATGVVLVIQNLLSRKFIIYPKWDLFNPKAISPVSGVKQVFQNIFFELIKLPAASAYLFLIGIIFTWLISADGSLLQLSTSIIAINVFFMIIVGTGEFFVRRGQYLKKLRMDQTEMKNELKETEKDPHLAGQQKAVYSEILNGTLAERVKASRFILLSKI